MNRERTYKAPVPVCWCRRCRAKTPSEYVDYPEEYERDKICAVCGAVKATEKTDEEPLTLGWKIYGSALLIAFAVMVIGVFCLGSLPVMLTAGLVDAVLIAGGLIVTHIPEWHR